MFFIQVKKMDNLRLKRLANGYYYVWYNIAGKRNKISTKTKDLTQAYIFLAEFENNFKERRQGNLFQVDLDAAEKRLLNANRDKSKKTTDAYRDIINKLRAFVPTWDKNENPDMFNAFIQSLFGKYSNATIYGIQSKLNTLFTCAKDLSLIPENMKFRKIYINRQTSPPLPVTQEDFDILYSACKNKNLRDVMTLDIFTGLRVSDIVKLKWSDIDFEKKMIRIAQKKGNRPLYCPILDIPFNLLLELKRNSNSEYVFTHQGKKYTTNGVSRAFHDLVVKTFGTNTLHFHCLRYGCAKKLFDLGVDIIGIKEMLGHKSIQTTMWYIGANRDLLEVCREKANEKLNEEKQINKKQESLFQDMCMN
jgi:integrase